MQPGLSRRDVLVGGGLCTLAVCGLAGCASYGPESEHKTAPASKVQVPTSEVPSGAGRVLAEQKIVVTQPSAGQFKAFSATCTHQGCTVGDVTTTINCPCHGSKYSIDDGSVVNGPATAPLPALPVTVEGSDLTIG